MPRRMVVALIVTVLTTSTPTHAEERTIAPGDSLRLTAGQAMESATQPVDLPRPGTQLVGRLVSIDDRTVTIHFYGHDQPVGIPRNAIETLEVYREGGRRFWRTVAIGLGAGALVGAVVGLAEGDDPPGTWVTFSAGDKAAVYATVLGLVGGLSGAMVAAGRAPRWEPVKLGTESINLGLEHRANGIGLKMSVSF